MQFNDRDLSLIQYTLEGLLPQQTQQFDRYYFQMVIDNDDPLKLGRIKFRIDQFHRDLPDDVLPWQLCQFGANNQFGKTEIPQMYSTILIRFLHGNFYNPVYFSYPTYKQRPIMNEDERDKLKPYNFVMSDMLYKHWNSEDFDTEDYEYNAKKVILRYPPSWVYNYDPDIQDKIVDDLPEQKPYTESDTYDKIKDIERYDIDKIKLQLKQWGTLYLDDLHDKEFRKYSPLDDFEKELVLQVIDYDNKKVISNRYSFNIHNTEWERRDQEYSGKYLEKTVLKDTTKQISVLGAKQDEYYTDLLKDNIRNDSNRITNKMDEFSNTGGTSQLDKSEYAIVEEIIKYPYNQNTFQIHFENSDSNKVFKQGWVKQFANDLYHKYHLNLTKDVYEEFEQLKYKSKANSELVNINGNYIKEEEINISETGKYEITSSITTPEDIVNNNNIEQKKMQDITNITVSNDFEYQYSVDSSQNIDITEEYTQGGTFSKQFMGTGTQPTYYIDLVDGIWVSKIHLDNKNLLFEQQNKIEQIQCNQNILINQKLSNIDVLQDVGDVTNEQPLGTIYLKGLKIDENQTTTYNQKQLQYTLNSTTTIDITAGAIINITGQIINLN